MLDVIPLSLGIETLGGVSTPLIERNTTIPASKSQVFSTAADNQTSTEIHIVQGERSIATDNKSLGRFILDGIPAAPRGVPQIEVTFDVDANGILNVKAKDNTSGKENSIRIEGSSGLSEEEIEKMKADAEANADSDKEKKEMIDLKNSADQMIFTADKSVKDAGDKVSDDLKKSIEEKKEALVAVKDGEDKEAIQKAIDELSAEIQKIMEEMQKAQQASEGEKTEEGDDVKEAEVVDDEDKEEEK